ncbi:hypothetical protein [Fimbriiglobus ruber]|uniref:Uncharacterized protein n=1 Tax=Fimbriiglobus ruber TaxID=1908690 RepID=A0A225D7H9_9BACT|nr:hypothetical protein [Fimbriiglobus ruber]OWK35594.1 hypothetical protein FRUB_08157 [Fimbriiglobus ruber]
MVGPTEEDHKRGLECVFGVLPMAENAAADLQDQRPVSADDFGKRGFVVAGSDRGYQGGVRGQEDEPTDERKGGIC